MRTTSPWVYEIIPVGLNYEMRTRFLSRVMISVGKPLEPFTYADQYREDPRGSVRALTEAIGSAIRHEAIHLPDATHTELLADLADLFRDAPPATRTPNIEEELTSGVDLEQRLKTEQRIAQLLTTLHATAPDCLERLKKQVDRFRRARRAHELPADFAEGKPHALRRRKETLKAALFATLTAPIAWLGLLHHAAPYLLTRSIALRAKDEAGRAIVALLVGTLLFLLSYCGFGLMFSLLPLRARWTVAYLCLLPFCGVFWLYYRKRVTRYADRILLRAIFVTRRAQYRRLLVQREQLRIQLASMMHTHLGSHLD